MCFMLSTLTIFEEVPSNFSHILLVVSLSMLYLSMLTQIILFLASNPLHHADDNDRQKPD